MALIKCPECGQDVSDKADVCIHCGYPLAKELNKIQVSEGIVGEAEKSASDMADVASVKKDPVPDSAPKRETSYASAKDESEQEMTYAIALRKCGHNKTKCAEMIGDNNILRMNYRDSKHFINKVENGKVNPIFNFTWEKYVLEEIQEKLAALGCETEIISIPEEEAKKLIPPMTPQQIQADARRTQEEVNKLMKSSGISSSSSGKPRCPTCGSTNVSRIGAINRGASVAAWGMMSKKIDKTYKCNDCKYTW